MINNSKSDSHQILVQTRSMTKRLQQKQNQKLNSDSESEEEAEDDDIDLENPTSHWSNGYVIQDI